VVSNPSGGNHADCIEVPNSHHKSNDRLTDFIMRRQQFNQSDSVPEEEISDYGSNHKQPVNQGNEGSNHDRRETGANRTAT
jgi:hypothetical protein